MIAAADESVRRAYRYCQWLAARHYENFPVASWVLPARLRPPVAAIYAFARTADDFADERRDPAEALRELAAWGAHLERCAAGHPDHPVFVALADTIRAYDLPVQLLRDLLTAFTRDVTVTRYDTWDDLLTNYCRYSANPVGRLVLRLFGYRDAALDELSDALCTALQLTNFWQDLAIDLDKGRIYVPQSVLRRHGVMEEAFGRRQVDERFRRAMAEAADVTEQWFQRGRTLPDRVSGRLRWELRATWHGGMTILARVRAASYDTWHRRPTLTALDKVRIGLAGLCPGPYRNGHH